MYRRQRAAEADKVLGREERANTTVRQGWSPRQRKVICLTGTASSSPGPKKLLALGRRWHSGRDHPRVAASGWKPCWQSNLGAGDEFVLGDYFDYIGGTSTGAVIAAGACPRGCAFEQLMDLYVTSVARTCSTTPRCGVAYHYRYDSRAAARELLQDSPR